MAARILGAGPSAYSCAHAILVEAASPHNTISLQKARQKLLVTPGFTLSAGTTFDKFFNDLQKWGFIEVKDAQVTVRVW